VAEISGSSASLETAEDAGKGPSGVVTRWLTELELSSKTEKGWRKLAEQVIERARDDKAASQSSDTSPNYRYNILASNIATQKPSLYGQTPRPDVRPRFKDPNPINRAVAKVLERALTFTLDAYDFDDTMKSAVHDMLVPGRAVDRIRYKPIMRKVTPQIALMPMMGQDGVTPDPAAGYMHPETREPLSEYQTGEQGPYIDGEPYDEKVYEETYCEHVAWDDFRRGPGKIWKKIPWVSFRHRFTREEAVEKFGKVADDIELDYSPDDLKDDKTADQDAFKRLTCWEFWDRDTRKVIWIAPSYKDAPLKTEDDPLNLHDFFPIPRPLYATEDPNSLIPVDDYRLYKDQADELDIITKRIAMITKVLKFRGIYDSTITEMEDLLNSDDNELVPSQNVMAILNAGGGLDKAVLFLPIDMAARVLAQLYNQREQVKQSIYEITGISDILRGASNPNETLGAQQIKASFGTQRLQDRQRAVQRYARDLIRIMAEIIAEKYEAMTLKLMTGTDVTPEMLEVMRLDGPRTFRIDIETDSTVATDAQADQRNLAEMTQGLAQLLQSLLPSVQSGMLTQEAAKSLTMSVLRRFKLGREVEDALDQSTEEQSSGQPGQQPQQGQAPNPQQGAQQQAAQAEQAKVQAEQSKAAQEAQIAQAWASVEQLKAAAESEKIENARALNAEEHRLALEEIAAKRARLFAGGVAA